MKPFGSPHRSDYIPSKQTAANIGATKAFAVRELKEWIARGVQLNCLPIVTFTDDFRHRTSNIGSGREVAAKAALMPSYSCNQILRRTRDQLLLGGACLLVWTIVL
jgi:hypothetical protein